MPSVVNMNGQCVDADQACLPIHDRGVLFGDGVYEVLAVYQGHIRAFEAHKQRLARSLEGIHLKAPDLLASLEAQIIALLQANALSNQDATIYLQVTRGSSEPRDFNFDPDAKPNYFIKASPIQFASLETLKKGYAAISHEDTRRADCSIKSTCLQASALLKHKAANAGCEEALLYRDGLLTEGSSSNVFIVKDGSVITPPLTKKILPGVTRKLIIDLCHQHKIPFVERDILFDELKGADELFITSTTRSIKPIISLDEQQIADGKPGPIWHKLITAYLGIVNP